MICRVFVAHVDRTSKDNRQAVIATCGTHMAQELQDNSYIRDARGIDRPPTAIVALVLPSWTPDAPAELSLRDSASLLFGVFALGVSASAPARHRHLRSALEFDHSAQFTSHPSALPLSPSCAASRSLSNLSFLDYHPY